MAVRREVELSNLHFKAFVHQINQRALAVEWLANKMLLRIQDHYGKLWG